MNRIKQLRKEKGLSQKELGTLLNINVPTVSKYESEDVDICASKLRILSELFNTSIDYILCNDIVNKEACNMYNNLGEIVANLLFEKNMSQQQLVQQSGIPKSTISKIVNGKRGQRASFEILNKLAKGFNIPIDELLLRLNNDETISKSTSAYENLGEILSKLLSEKNMQQQELAKQSGLTKATISRLISGSRGKRTSFETLSKLAKGLNMSVDELLSKLNGDDVSSFVISEPLKPYDDTDSLTGREWKLIREFRELPEERKIKIEARIEAEYDIVMEAKQARSKDA